MKRSLLDPVRNICMRELIGSRMTVVSHPDPTQVGRSGVMADETRNMFLMMAGEGVVKVPKKGGKFELEVRFEGRSQMVILDGDELIVRPEDRTKRCERTRAQPVRAPK